MVNKFTMQKKEEKKPSCKTNLTAKNLKVLARPNNLLVT